jgi:signal transduction histidine kinase
MRPITKDYALGFGRHFACWTLIGLFFFSQDLAQSYQSHEALNWIALLECWLSRAYIWGLLAPIVVWLARRFRFERRHAVQWAAVHLLLGASLAALAAALAAVTGMVLKIPWYWPGLRTALPAGMAFAFHASFLTYWIILAVYEAFENYRTSQQERQRALQAEVESSNLKTQLAQAQLRVLKAQLQPHFLFNTLNAIVTLIRLQRNADAEEMTGRLGELMRSAIEETDAQEVPLRTELKFLHLYLEIEQVRFRDRLTVEVESSPAVMDALVPYMCLQPLAENAVRHGIARRSSPGKVTVAARRLGTSVELTIRDDGPGLAAPEDRRAGGLGIANTRERLAQLYGDKAMLNLESACGQGTQVTIRLPYHLTEASV